MELLVSELGLLEGGQLVLSDEVVQVDFFVQRLDFRVVLGFLDGAFGVLFVGEVDEPVVCLLVSFFGYFLCHTRLDLGFLDYA